MKGQHKGKGKSGLERDELPATGSPERVVITISMSRDDLAQLDQRARNHKVERSSFVRRLIRDGWLSRRQAQGAGARDVLLRGARAVGRDESDLDWYLEKIAALESL